MPQDSGDDRSAQPTRLLIDEWDIPADTHTGPVTKDDIHEARHYICQLAARHLGHNPDHLHDVGVCASEILTNAFLHTDTKQIHAQVTISGRRLRVEVGDDGTGGPVATPVEDPLAETGRGLLLVRALGDAWGVEQDGDGRVVWFEVEF